MIQTIKKLLAEFWHYFQPPQLVKPTTVFRRVDNLEYAATIEPYKGTIQFTVMFPLLKNRTPKGSEQLLFKYFEDEGIDVYVWDDDGGRIAVNHSMVETTNEGHMISINARNFRQTWNPFKGAEVISNDGAVVRFETLIRGALDLNNYPYVARINRKSIDECKQWCRDNLQLGEWREINNIFLFKNSDHALMAKLYT